MPTLEYLDKSYDCTTAIKGEDYIRLLDENGCLVASFDGIADFSAFELHGGEYTEPTPAHDCYLAVIRDDGTFARGGHRCSDIVPRSKLVTVPIGTNWTGEAAPYTQTIEIEGVKENSVIEIALPSTATAVDVAAFQALSLQDGGQAVGSITLRAFGAINSESIPVNVIIRGDL